MAKVTGDIYIERPVELVFDYVADERNEPRYNPKMLSSEKLTEGPIGAGTRFQAVHTSGRGSQVMSVEITDYDRPRWLASRTTMPVMECHGGLTFDSDGDGTRMGWMWDVHLKGPAKIFSPVAGLIGRRSERACWKGLKQLLETTSRPSRG
jgi:hypothetical protein